jgi:cytochrome c peroxidase
MAQSRKRLLIAVLYGTALLATGACSGRSDESAGQGPQAEPTLAATTDELILRARDLFKPIPLNPPAIPGVDATPGMIALGKALFFDPRLSVTHSISCASCHYPGLGGADNSPTSAGFHGERGGRNAPTVFNSAYNFVQFWDGRAKDLVEQAGGPLVNPVEMASPKAHVTEQLLALPGYLALFQAAFPGQDKPVSLENAQKAIAAFEATLNTPNAPFDTYLRGDANALNAQQKAGLTLFIDKGCAACHSGVNIGGSMYQKFGVVADPGPKYRPPADKGRGAITGKASDDYFYKVPTLRNITLTAPYFHTGSEPDLKKAIDVMAQVQLGQTLTPDETDKIAAFLGSLTGQQPEVAIPQLPASDAKSPPPDK